MRFLVSLVLLLTVVTVFGCSGPVADTTTTTDSVTATIKPILEKLAETGNVEAASELQSYLEEDLAGVDQAKSDALMKDWQELQSMTSPDDIKAKAQEMLSKL